VAGRSHVLLLYLFMINDQASSQFESINLSQCFYYVLPVVALLPSLPDLGPVLAPLGSAACRLSVWGPKFFSLGSQIQRHVRSSRHVPIERNHSNDARGLDMLLID
jgi:hypothetical protein